MNYSVIENRINWGIRFWLCLLIFWLPYSPAAIEISVVISFILWILKQIVKRKATNVISSTPLNRPIFFFVIICIFSALSSAFWQESLSNFLTKTLEWFIVYFLVTEAFTTRKQIYIVLGVFLFTLAATAIDSLIQYYWTYKDIFLGHVIEPGTRATAGFKSPNGLGAYLTVAIPLIFACFFKKNERLQYRLLFTFLFLLAIWSLILTFSRGAWLAAFLGIIFFILLYKFPQRRLEFYIVSGLLFLLLVLFTVFGIILTNDMHIAALRYDTAYWRLHVWEDTFKMIQDSPIFGHGINTFMHIFQEYRRDVGTNPTYAHNSYLQLVAEAGLLGLIAFLWIFVRLFRWFLSSVTIYGIKNDDFILLAMGLLSGIVAFLLQSFFDNHFYSLQLSIYLWFMVGLFVATVRQIQWQKVNVR